MLKATVAFQLNTCTYTLCLMLITKSSPIDIQGSPSIKTIMNDGGALGEKARAISNRTKILLWVASDQFPCVLSFGITNIALTQCAQFPLTWNIRPRPVLKRENNLIDAMMTECWSTNIQNLWFTIRHCQRLQTHSFLTMNLAEQPAQNPGPFTDVHLFLAPNRKLATFWATWETGCGNKSK